ncbi:restriction endonuclease subunit S [uncultured Alistipes sp.]|uniref:restriction endonuclease subunit S n=1 Tax=uncultured Alistipes sp. TaxID=538949 RepID=UPI00266FCBDD|nr:restriction endonuclease subunit S [uncultured Alistipes sp.]
MKTNEKDTQQGIVPALRFPEFLEAGGWVYLKGDKVFEQISNRKHSSNLPILAISQEHGAVPRDLIDYKVIVSDEGLENYKVVERGDFIISLRSFQGGIEYSAYNGICSPAYIILRKRLDVDNQFFKYYFKSRAFIQDLNKNLEGIRDGKMVSYKQFSEILLPIPSISNKAEQQKIADCLSSIDALIKAAENKIDELKAHKKGLMQQLFPAEGETVPALRFPEFQNAGEWTKISLGELTYKVSKKNKAGKLYPIYSINNKQGFIRQEEQFTGVDSNDRGYDLSLYSIVGSKTFAYNPARINVGSIGYSGDLKDVIISSLYVCFKTSETVNDEFLLKYFETESFKKAVLNSVEGGIRSYLFYDNFAKINLYLPPNYDTAEQQKIADCLSSVDNLIIAQTNRFEALKAHKKGLMQQLFPNIE